MIILDDYSNKNTHNFSANKLAYKHNIQDVINAIKYKGIQININV